MPGTLTYAAVTLLARDRIGQIRDMLAAKIQNALVPVSELERHIHHLAVHAHRLMNDAPSIDPPLRLYTGALGEGVSKFSILGSVGPDLLRHAGFGMAGQRWLWDAIHKGNPDANREHVLVRSTDFALELFRRAEARITAELRGADISQATRKMRSYVLGHMCHVATDVVSHPFVDGASLLPSRDTAISAIETRVAADVLNRGTSTATRQDRWASWLPTEGEVPVQFFEAYRETVEALVPVVMRQGAFEKGFGAFEEKFASDDPPRLSTGLVRQGYDAYRTIAAIGTSWDYRDWLEATWWMFVPSVVWFPLVLPLENAVLLRRSDAFIEAQRPGERVDDVKKKGLYELLLFPFATTAFVPLFGSLAATVTAVRMDGSIIFGWVTAGVWLVQAVSFFGTAGSLPHDSLWFFLLILPMILSLIHVIWTLVEGRGEPRHLQLAFGTLVHLLMGWLFILCYVGFLYLGVEGALNTPSEPGLLVLMLLIWGAIVFALWLITCVLLRCVFSARLAADAAGPVVTGQPHFVDLFDDESLFRVPAGTSPTLADLYYPSGLRPLLKLWWQAPGAPIKLQVFSDRLVFRFDPSTDQTILLPLAPTRLVEFAAYLERVVTDGTGAASRQLKVQLVYPNDLDYELPPGEVFAITLNFAAIGRTEDTATTISHALKRRLSTRFGRSGPEQATERRPAQATSAAARIHQAAATSVTLQRQAGADDFVTFFRPGDVIEIDTAPVQRRVVVSVDSATQITVSTPFNPALPVAPAPGLTFRRIAVDYTVNSAAGAGTVTSGPDVTDLTLSAGNSFGVLFRPGDTIQITPPAGGPILRRVVALASDTLMTLDEPLTFAGAAGYLRAGEEAAEGFDFIADPDDNIFTGGPLMNHAADLAALLCLGATSHLLKPDERPVTNSANPVSPVFQVFRNWNLDRRRVNEWKMLIAGGAVSEKRGNPAAVDAALFSPLPSTWQMLSGAGEPLSNQLGWLPLFRRWLDMARRPAQNTLESSSFLPGDPSNFDLSRALSYLFDMRAPVPAP